MASAKRYWGSGDSPLHALSGAKPLVEGEGANPREAESLLALGRLKGDHNCPLLVYCQLLSNLSCTVHVVYSIVACPYA